MTNLQIIIERMRRVLRIEKDITERERDQFEEKKHDEESYWGVGGNYCRYEKCVDQREAHLEELEALDKLIRDGAQPTEKLQLYPWYCPTCQDLIYLNDSRCRRTNTGTDIIDCPICQRTLYRGGVKTTWDVIKGSKYTEVRS